MKTRLLSLLLLSAVISFAQKFNPDAYGYVADKKFHTLIKERNYELVGAFDTVSKSPLQLLAIVSFNGKFGLINQYGKEVVPPAYEIMGNYTEGFAVVGNQKKFGLIDVNGVQVLPVQFEAIGIVRNRLVPVKQNGKWGFFKEGKEIIPPKYDGVYDYDWRIYHVSIGQSYGVVNTDGVEIIPPAYSIVISSGNFFIARKGAKSGVLNKNGELVVPLQYDVINAFREGYAQVQREGRWGFIDSTGREVIPVKYQQVSELVDGLAAVSLDKQWGAVDANGREIIPMIYDRAGSIGEGFVFTELNGIKTLVNKKGEQLLSDFSAIGNFHEGLVAFRNANWKWGYLNAALKLVIDTVFNDARGFVDGRALFMENGNYGLINHQGKIVAQPIYYSIYEFREGRAAVESKKQWGFIDSNGKEVLKPVYDEVFYFENGFALVKRNTIKQKADDREIDLLSKSEPTPGKFGYVDLQGNFIIPLKYDQLWNFKKGFALFEIDKKRGMVDRYGNEFYFK